MKSVIIVILFLVSIQLNAQFIEKGVTKIFRGITSDAYVILKLDSDSTYSIDISKNTWCSLCDFDSLQKYINQKGSWFIDSNNKVHLIEFNTENEYELEIKSADRLKPLFVINRHIYSDLEKSSEQNVEKINFVINTTIENSRSNLDLILETYPNGIVKETRDLEGEKPSGYVVKYNRSGETISVTRYKKGKIKK
ncbi:hypothetical protein [Sediminitomix flava]|uniref:Uncharacterized protein n=1 Tax=Sediminitomix flava TaxID=379075 RepID=A0A315YV48_SEDFL|nr:hypothetical protein [Sediminitomix flava]PWJ33249.1 hypothetical protein BC781_11411 [Sediminitomix flava]